MTGFSTYTLSLHRLLRICSSPESVCKRLFQKKLCAPQQAGTVPAAPALGVPGWKVGGVEGEGFTFVITMKALL